MFRSTSWSLMVLLAAFAFAGTTSAQTPDQELTRWFDVQSKQTIRAYFVGAENGSVTLRTRSGETISISVDRLSSSNQRFIRNFQKTSAAKQPAVAKENPIRQAKKTPPRTSKQDALDSPKPDAVKQNSAIKRTAKPKEAKPVSVQPDAGQPRAAKKPDPKLAKSRTLHGIPWKPMDNVLTDQPLDNEKPVFWFRVLGDLEGFM